jgi:site-specific DNA-cytosine methylase
MARIIGEVRPRYAFVENSPMLTSRGLGTVLGDLAALGFDAKWGVISAADVGAPHLRERIWIVGHANVHGIPASNEKQVIQRKTNRTQENIQQSARSNISEISNNNSDSQSTGAIHAEQVCESDIPDTDNGWRGRREISGEGGNGRFELYGKDEQMADTEDKRLQGGGGSR